MKTIARHTDLLSAILMSTAAVLTAWATYEGAQWDSAAADERSRSAIYRSDAGRAAADAVTQSIVDATVWLEWEKAINLDRDELAIFLRNRFSPALEIAQDNWLGSRALLDSNENPIGKLPQGTPLSLDSYIPPAQIKAEEFSQKAEEGLAAADVASAQSGRYIMQAVLLAMVLFFGSAAAKFRSPKLQLGMTGLALLMLAISAFEIVKLPII